MIRSDKPKCSNKDHARDPALVFCADCNRYLCAVCEKLHSGFLSDHHTVLVKDLTLGSQVVTGKCTVPGHHNSTLEFYCKEHNIPCCVACLCPKEGIGKHAKCTTTPLAEMEQEMRSSLSSSIKALGEAATKAEAAMAQLQEMLEKNRAAKEETANQIKKGFDAIRKAVNIREKELLEEVEKQWENEGFYGKLLETGATLPGEAKQIAAATAKAAEHWDSEKLPEMAQHYTLVCELKVALKKFESGAKEAVASDLKVNWSPGEKGITAFVEEIMKFGSVFIKPKFSLAIKASPNGTYVVEGPSQAVVRKTSGDRYDCTAIGKDVIPLNAITRWSIKILKSRNNNGSGFFIGVAPSDIDQNEDHSYNNKCGWYFNCYYSSLWSGPPHNYKGKVYGPRKGDGKYIHTGDIVGVVLDTAKGELSFVLNGVNLGVAFDGIPLDKHLVPCVLLYYQGDSVELIEN